MKKTIFNWGNLSKYRNEIYGFSAFWIVIFHIFDNYKKIQFNWTSVYLFLKGSIGVDIFLLMAGVCSYFSFKKSYNIKEFLKKRIFKILKVYFLFCIPFFVIRYAICTPNYTALFHEITFSRQKLNSFWFILCILICYFIYPIIYRFLKEKKFKPIFLGLGLYVLGLFLLCTFNKPLFSKYEICLTRIPIFVIGSLLGPLVYEKKPIKQGIYLFFLLFLLSYGPLFYIINKISFLKMYSTIFFRFYLSTASVGVIFLLNIIFELFDLKKIKKFLRYLSEFTLEIYVVHIVLFHVVNLLKLNPTKVSTTFIFGIIFTVISILVAKILSIILAHIKIPKKNKKLNEA